MKVVALSFEFIADSHIYSSVRHNENNEKNSKKQYLL